MGTHTYVHNLVDKEQSVSKLDGSNLWASSYMPLSFQNCLQCAQYSLAFPFSHLQFFPSFIIRSENRKLKFKAFDLRCHNINRCKYFFGDHKSVCKSPVESELKIIMICVIWRNSSLHFYTLGKQKNIPNFKEFVILRCVMASSLYTSVLWGSKGYSKLCFKVFRKGRILFSLFAFAQQGKSMSHCDKVCQD